MTATLEAPTHTGDAIQFTRQELILEPAKARAAKVALFGQGTVGSNAAMEIMRLGVPNLHLFDFDNVEPHNLPSQRFDKQHLGMNKAEAMKQQLAFMCNADGKHVKVTTKKVEGPVMVEGIVILGVDTMESRRLIWEKALKPQRKVDLVLDFRMSANLLQCYAFDPRDERYETTLFDVNEVSLEVAVAAITSSCVRYALRCVIEALLGQPLPAGGGAPSKACCPTYRMARSAGITTAVTSGVTGRHRGRNTSSSQPGSTSVPATENSDSAPIGSLQAVMTLHRPGERTGTLFAASGPIVSPAADLFAGQFRTLQVTAHEAVRDGLESLDREHVELGEDAFGELMGGLFGGSADFESDPGHDESEDLLRKQGLEGNRHSLEDEVGDVLEKPGDDELDAEHLCCCFFVCFRKRKNFWILVLLAKSASVM